MSNPLQPQPAQYYPLQPQPAQYYPPVQMSDDPISQPKLDPWYFGTAALMQDRNATVAKVGVQQSSSYSGPPDFNFTATGSSKREQGDKFNARTGELLALSRAYLNLSRDLYAAARKLVEPAPEDAEPEVWAATDEEQYEQDVDPALASAVESFNAAADALNSATRLLRALTE